MKRDWTAIRNRAIFTIKLGEILSNHKTVRPIDGFRNLPICKLELLMRTKKVVPLVKYLHSFTVCLMQQKSDLRSHFLAHFNYAMNVLTPVEKMRVKRGIMSH